MAEQRIKEEYYKTIQESGFLCGIPEIEQKNAVRGLQIRIRVYKEEELIFLEGEEKKSRFFTPEPCEEKNFIWRAR